MAANQVVGRKIIVFNMVSLDGFFEGPKGNIDWHNVDQEFNEFAIEQLETVGSLLFGRLSYQLMAGYWPTAAALADDPVVAAMMNSLPKIVFSTTLERADWNNTTLIKGDLAAEIAKLKRQPGQDLFIFGSANLAAAVARLDLIDEYRLIINPVVLGRGTPMFQGIDTPLKLRLLKQRSFKSGNILLYYEPLRAGQSA